MHYRIFTLTVLYALLAAPQTVIAQASDNLVNTIMQLRSEVEQLYGQLDDGKQDHRATMRSLAAQRADLEAQINRQEISLRQLELDALKLEREIERQESENTSLKPVLQQGLDLLEQNIRTGSPFKQSERLDDVKSLRQRIESDAETPERGLAQLWASWEDQLRLTRENGLFKQEIQLAGRTVLADVAKVGNVMLFFRTPDNIVGYTATVEGSTVYQAVTDPIQIDQIGALFDAYEKQIRTGYFELPTAFVFEDGVSKLARTEQ